MPACVVEEWGWDEAFVGVSTDDPEAFAAELQGAGARRDRAVAAPSGSARPSCRPRRRPASPSPAASPGSTRREWIPTMGDRPVTAIWGIGAAHRGAPGRRSASTPSSELARADHDELAPALRADDRTLARACSASAATTRRSSTSRTSPRAAAARRRSTRDLTDRRRDRRARRPPGARGHRVGRRRGPARHPRVGQGAHGDVLHPHEDQQARRADDRHRGGRRAAPDAVLDRFELDRPVRLLGVRVVLEADPDSLSSGDR